MRRILWATGVACLAISVFGGECIDNRPEVWMIVATEFHCQPCHKAKRAFAKSDADLPYKLVVVEEIPEWLKADVTGFPYFYWTPDADKVYGGKIAKKRQGFSTVEKFTATWESTRIKPTSDATAPANKDAH